MMRIETLATGDEVVNGDVIDSNSAYVSASLSRRGYLIAKHTALPDDKDALEEGIREISERADLCICSGGLGPTEDDLTSEIVAKVLGVSVQVDEEALRRMKERFLKFGYRFSANNEKSSRIPKGCMVLQNDVGSAPGFSVKIRKCQFFFLPGVPREFYFFVDQAVLKWVETSFPSGFGAVVQLKTLGYGESHLAEKFEDYPRLFHKIKVGYRIHSPEVWIKLTAEGGPRQECLKTLQPAIDEAKRRLGNSIFGSDQDELDEIVHKLLLEKGLALSTAESCTGGRISQMLTAHPGSSAYFMGGAVVYSNELKQKLLGVESLTLSQFGAVSSETALAMAQGARKNFGTDLAIAVTGIAGPTGGTPDKPVGLVYLSLASPSGDQVLRKRFRGARLQVQKAAAYTALEMVRRQIMCLEPITDD